MAGVRKLPNGRKKKTRSHRMTTATPRETKEAVIAFEVVSPRRTMTWETAKKNEATRAKDSAISPQKGKRLLLFSHVLRPFEISVGVGLGGHQGLYAPLGQLLRKFIPDKRILIRVLDLVLGPVLDFFRVSVELHGRMQGEVSRGRGAGVEMLVEPAVGGNKHAALVPGGHDFLFSFFPQDRIAFARGDNDGATGTMAVCLLVGLRRKNRHVRRHLRVRELNKNTPAPGPALDVGV